MKWYQIVLVILLIPIGEYLSRLVHSAKYGNIPHESLLKKLYFKIQEWREKRKEKKKEI